VSQSIQIYFVQGFDAKKSVGFLCCRNWPGRDSEFCDLDSVRSTVQRAGNLLCVLEPDS